MEIAKMIECEICFEDYQEGGLELHRETCILRLIFRCSLCDEDYMSKEGLWNHLDLHEITDECKELHYQEIEAKYKLHHCARCNDQRAYSESSYRKHVQEVHDNIFQRFSDRGENLHAEKHNSDYAPHCQAMVQIKEENVANEDEHFSKRFRARRKKNPSKKGKQRKCLLKLPTSRYLTRYTRYKHRLDALIKKETQLELTNSDVDQATNVTISETGSMSKTSGTMCVHCDKDYASASRLRHNIFHCHRSTKCSICGEVFEGTAKVRYHKIMTHTKPKYRCAVCSKKFYFKHHAKRHSNACVPALSDIEHVVGEEACNKCSHCGLNVSSDVALVRHILTHHDPVACNFCGITLSNLAEAQHHVKTVHTKPMLTCQHCSMQFSWQNRLKTHVSKCKHRRVPCDSCGKMFPSVLAANKHRYSICNVYKGSMEQELKNAEKDDSSIEMEKIWPPLVNTGMSRTRCYFCEEVFSSPGYLIQHLKRCQKLTNCDVCGITVLGYLWMNNHKIKCHSEPKHKCATCGMTFHRIKEYYEHCYECENKMFLCKICGHTMKLFNSFVRHTSRFHPERSTVECLQIVQYPKQATNNDLQISHSAEETTISISDDKEQATVDVSDARSGGHLSNASAFPLNSNTERQEVPEKDEHFVNEPFSCKICGISLASYYQINYHMLTDHAEEKYQCPHCARSFFFKKKVRRAYVVLSEFGTFL